MYITLKPYMLHMIRNVEQTVTILLVPIFFLYFVGKYCTVLDFQVTNKTRAWIYITLAFYTVAFFSFHILISYPFLEYLPFKIYLLFLSSAKILSKGSKKAFIYRISRQAASYKIILGL